MDFSEALKALREGYRVTNRNWNGKEMYLAIQPTYNGGESSAQYIYIQLPKDHPTYPGARVPWTPSQLDLMSDGWKICGPEVG